MKMRLSGAHFLIIEITNLGYGIADLATLCTQGVA